MRHIDLSSLAHVPTEIVFTGLCKPKLTIKQNATSVTDNFGTTNIDIVPRDRKYTANGVSFRPPDFSVPMLFDPQFRKGSHKQPSLYSQAYLHSETIPQR